MPDEKHDDDTGEIEIDPDVAAHEWRRSVSRALNRQARLEAERTGASKTTGKIVAFFGSTITAAAIGGFVWLWDTQATSQQHEARIARMSEEQQEQTEALETTDATLDAIERRVTQNEAAQRAVNERLDRILEELQRQRGNRRQ
jgi:hypothetical protein